MMNNLIYFFLCLYNVNFNYIIHIAYLIYYGSKSYINLNNNNNI